MRNGSTSAPDVATTKDLLLPTAAVCGGYVAVWLQAWMNSWSVSPLVRECDLEGAQTAGCEYAARISTWVESLGSLAPWAAILPTIVAVYLLLARPSSRPLFLRATIVVLVARVIFVAVGVLEFLMLDLGWFEPGAFAVPIGFATLNALCAFGLWRLRPWARTLTQVLQIPTILFVLLRGFSFPSEPGLVLPLLSIAVHLLIILYLIKPQTRELFSN